MPMFQTPLIRQKNNTDFDPLMLIRSELNTQRLLALFDLGTEIPRAERERFSLLPVDAQERVLSALEMKLSLLRRNSLPFFDGGRRA